MTKAHGILSMQAVENCLKNRKNPKDVSGLPSESDGSNTEKGRKRIENDKVFGFHSGLTEILCST